MNSKVNTRLYKKCLNLYESVFDMYGYVDMTDVFRIKTLYTAFTEVIGSDYFFVGERHNFWELVIVADGEVGVTAGENAWVLHKGQVILHPPMEFHRVWSSGNSGRIIVFSFGAEGLPMDVGGSFAVCDSQQADMLLKQLKECFQREGINIVGMVQPQSSAHILLKQWELFILELLGQKKQLQHEERTRTAKNYAAIVKVLEEHVHENLTIAQIAELCNMGQVSMKQTFSRYTGMGVINYFNRLKIERATHMLQDGSSVQETADALGFSSQNYFSTVFKRIMGKTPTAYK
jgi:AraC-like DNA-binding protein